MTMTSGRVALPRDRRGASGISPAAEDAPLGPNDRHGVRPEAGKESRVERPCHQVRITGGMPMSPRQNGNSCKLLHAGIPNQSYFYESESDHDL
jgi:hypothetical protein